MGIGGIIHHRKGRGGNPSFGSSFKAAVGDNIGSDGVGCSGQHEQEQREGKGHRGGSTVKKLVAGGS